MTKKVFPWMLSAILFCGISAMMLTSCTTNDNAVIISPSQQITGKWYAEQNQPGSFDADGETVSYQKVVQYADFRDDGTGFWSIIFVDEAGHAIDVPGYFCGGSFKYVDKSSNTINIKLTSAGIPILNDSWDVTFSDDRLYVASSEVNHALAPITDEQNALAQEWLRELGLGFEGKDVPNTVNISLKGVFGRPLKATSLTVSVNDAHHTIKDTTASSEFTTSIVPVKDRTLLIAAHIGEDTYVSTKKHMTFETGETYNIDMSMTKVDAVQLWKDGPKFASVNVGAIADADYGCYYAWGATADNEQQGQYYNWSNTPYYISKWDSWERYKQDDYSTLLPEDDAATANWGSPWRMPTNEEMLKLGDPEYCKAEWIVGYNDTDVRGCLFTGAKKGYTDKSIFLAAGGYRIGDGIDRLYRDGYYWTSTHNKERDNCKLAWTFYFYGVGILQTRDDSANRYLGFLVRPVQ